jgi:hypothetical protein
MLKVRFLLICDQLRLEKLEAGRKGNLNVIAEVKLNINYFP